MKNKTMIRLCPVCGGAPKVQVWHLEGQTIGARIFCPITGCGLPYYAEGDTLEEAAEKWNEFTVDDAVDSMTAFLRSIYLERMKNEEHDTK